MLTDEQINLMVGETEPDETEEVAETKETVTPEENKGEPKEEQVTGEEVPAPPADKTAEQLLEEERARIAEIERVNNGLLQAKTSAMQKYQKTLSELQSTQEQLKALQEQARLKDEAKIVDAGSQNIDRLKVEFDDEGNAYVPAGSIPVNADLVKKIEALELQLSQAANKLQEDRVKAEYEGSLLSEKEGYKTAIKDLKEQWDFVKNGLFDQFVREKEIQFSSNTDVAKAQALEVAMSPEFQKAFYAKYPNGDIETLMQAGIYSGKYYERKALDAVLSKKQPVSTHKPLPGDKPLPLATATGTGMAQEIDDLNKFANMTPEEFLRMSPDEERRMNRLLKEKG